MDEEMCGSGPTLPDSLRPGDGKILFSTVLSHMRVPTGNCLLEAYILLMARDQHKIYKSFWSSMLIYLAEYVEATGLIVLEKLEP